MLASLTEAHALQMARIDGAREDLTHIVEDAVDEMKDDGFEAVTELRENVRYIYVDKDNVISLGLEFLSQVPLGDNDPALLGADVRLSNQGDSALGGAFPVANLICELVGNRMEWFMLRFRSNGDLTPYTAGPSDREHGFEVKTFATERSHMLANARRWYHVSKTKLTPETFITLMAETMEKGGIPPRNQWIDLRPGP